MMLTPFAGQRCCCGMVAKYACSVELQGDTLLLSFLQCTHKVLMAVAVLPGVYAIAHRDGQVTEWGAWQS